MYQPLLCNGQNEEEINQIHEERGVLVLYKVTAASSHVRTSLITLFIIWGMALAFQPCHINNPNDKQELVQELILMEHNNECCKFLPVQNCAMIDVDVLCKLKVVIMGDGDQDEEGEADSHVGETVVATFDQVNIWQIS